MYSGIVKLKAKGLNSWVRLYMISITDFDPCHSLLSVSQQNSLHFSLLMEVRNCHQVSSKSVQKVNRLSSFQQLKILILGPTLLTIWSNSRVISTSSRKVILEVIWLGRLSFQIWRSFRFLGSLLDVDIHQLDWVEDNKKIKAFIIYETSL